LRKECRATLERSEKHNANPSDRTTEVETVRTRVKETASNDTNLSSFALKKPEEKRRESSLESHLFTRHFARCTLAFKGRRAESGAAEQCLALCPSFSIGPSTSGRGYLLGRDGDTRVCSREGDEGEEGKRDEEAGRLDLFRGRYRARIGGER